VSPYQLSSDRHLSRRHFLKAGAAAASGLALSGCGWTLANVRTTIDTPSDVLYLYTWAGYTDDELIKEFYDETGIRVIADVFSSNEEMLAKLQAGAGGAYSIIYPSDYMVRKMVSLDWLVDLDRDRLLGLDELFPRFQNPGYDTQNRHSIPMSWGTTGLIYNSRKLQPNPTDWDYLWDNRQQLSKRISLLNDGREVIGAALRSLGYSYNTTNIDAIRQAYQKLTELKSAIATFTSDAWTSQIITGDLTIAMCYSADAVQVIEESPGTAYLLPDSGSSVWTDTMAIPRTAPNIEGAYAWLNFMLRPDVSARVCERLSFATPNQVAFGLLPEEVQNNDSLFPPESALEKSEELKPLPTEVGEAFDLYWTRLTSG